MSLPEHTTPDELARAEEFADKIEGADGKREKANARQRRWRSADPERARARGREWRNKNLEKARAVERESTRKRRAKNPEAARDYDRRRKQLKRLERYGLTQESPHNIFESQNNACAICKRKDFKQHLDHCHRTGTVRGILCGPCNMALGLFKDNVELLAAAIEYLEQSK